MIEEIRRRKRPRGDFLLGVVVWVFLLGAVALVWSLAFWVVYSTLD